MGPLPHLELVLALEHIEGLVLVLMDVQRGVDRLLLLEEREGAAGRCRRGADQHLDLTEAQELAGSHVSCFHICDCTQYAEAQL